MPTRIGKNFWSLSENHIIPKLNVKSKFAGGVRISEIDLLKQLFLIADGTENIFEDGF
jgi:hypothetical protein